MAEIKEKKPKKSKGLLRKIAILSTIVAGVIGVTYGTVPQVREKVDEVINVVVENVGGGERKELEALPSVTNLQYDEKTKLLTFDEVEGNRGYKIGFYNKTQNRRFTETVDEESFELDANLYCRTGDEVEFEVIAKGDYENYKNSVASYHEYTVQYVDANFYEGVYNFFQDQIIYRIATDRQLSVRNPKLQTFYKKGNVFYMEGTGTSVSKRPLNFTLELNYDSYASKIPADFSDITDIMEFCQIMGTDGIKNYNLKVEYADSYYDLKDVLQENGEFDEYLEDGYKVEILKFENSNITRENGKAYFSYTASYRATLEGEESITFKQKHVIETDDVKEYINMDQFMNAMKNGKEIEVESTSKDILDSDLNNQLIKIFALAEAKNVQESSLDR